MARLGVFLLSVALILLFGGMAIKPAMEKLYNITNSSSSYNMTPTAQVLWQFMPYIVIGILLAIAVAYLTGKIGGHRDNGGEE